MNNAEIVSAWIAENRPEIDRWISEAMRRFLEDASVRLPRTEAARRNGMESWLEQRRLKLDASLQEAFPHQFPSLAQNLSPSLITRVFDELVWPQVKPEVQSYAIFGFASAWVGRHMGDATTVGTPRCDGWRWYVPIGVSGHGSDLGRIVLNLDGEVIPELTTTRRDLLEAIREPSLPPVAAAAR